MVGEDIKREMFTKFLNKEATAKLITTEASPEIKLQCAKDNCDNVTI